MPGTINGVGTRYWGRRSLQRRDGRCEHCGRVGPLEDYETRLWFVVFFVPVIPLGRKQILDQCKACTWHRAVPLAAWQEHARAQVAEALAAAGAAPDELEPSLRLVGTLLGLGRRDDARRTVEALAARFPDVARVHGAAAEVHLERGDVAAARPCWRRAADLEPAGATPQARHAQLAAALAELAEGDPATARRRTRALEEAHERAGDAAAGERAHAAWALACAWQEAAGAGRAGPADEAHEEALRLFARVLAVDPAAARNADFYAALRRSEQALGRATSLVPTPPPRPPRGRGPLVGAAVAALAAAGVAFASWAAAQARTLHVVNGTGRPASVAVDGGAPVEVAPGARVELTVAEGLRRVRVAQEGAAPREDALALETSPWTRLFARPVFVYNVAGAGLVYHAEVVYDRRGGVPPVYAFRAGEVFLAWPAVDHRFEPFPERVSTRGGAPVRRTQVDWLPVAPEHLAGAVEGLEAPPSTRVAFGLAHLALRPDHEPLLGALGALARAHPEARPLLAAGLEPGLEARPLRVEWHRAYQDALDDPDALRARYDAWLATAPDDAGWLYLRGRLEGGRAGEPWLERAVAADPRAWTPRFALGLRRLTDGRPDLAAPLLEEARDLRPDRPDVGAALWQARRALGLPIEPQVAAAFANAPFALWLLELLVDLRVERGDDAGARAALEALEVHVAPDDPDGRLARAAAALVASVRGDGGEAARAAAALEPDAPLRRQVELHGRLLAGQLAEARAGLGVAGWREHLLVCLAARAAGDEALADVSRRAAVGQLARGDREERAAAAAFEAGPAPDAPLALDVRGARLLLAAWAGETRGEARAALARRARLLAPGAAPEARLVRAALDALEARSTR